MLWFYQSSFQSEQFILTSPNHDMRTLIGWNTLHIFIVYKHDSLGLAANRGLPKWPIFKILCAISSIWLTFEPSQANILRCWAIFNGQILKKQSSHLVGLAIREFRTHWRQVRSIFEQILSRRTSNVDYFPKQVWPISNLVSPLKRFFFQFWTTGSIDRFATLASLPFYVFGSAGWPDGYVICSIFSRLH